MYPLPGLPHGHSETTVKHRSRMLTPRQDADTVQISPVQPALTCTCLRLVPQHFITRVGLFIYQLEVRNSSDGTGTLLPPRPSPSFVPGNCDPVLVLPRPLHKVLQVNSYHFVDQLFSLSLSFPRDPCPGAVYQQPSVVWVPHSSCSPDPNPLKDIGIVSGLWVGTCTRFVYMIHVHFFVAIVFI